MEIKSIQQIDVTFDFKIVGMEAAEVDQLTLSVGGKVADPVVAAPPENPVSKWGDIWRLGPHRVGCGDSQDLAFMRRVVGSDLVDAAFLDPPYNVRINGNAVGA